MAPMWNTTRKKLVIQLIALSRSKNFSVTYTFLSSGLRGLHPASRFRGRYQRRQEASVIVVSRLEPSVAGPGFVSRPAELRGSEIRRRLENMRQSLSSLEHRRSESRCLLFFDAEE